MIIDLIGLQYFKFTYFHLFLGDAQTSKPPSITATDKEENKVSSMDFHSKYLVSPVAFVFTLYGIKGTKKRGKKPLHYGEAFSFLA